MLGKPSIEPLIHQPRNPKALRAVNGLMLAVGLAGLLAAALLAWQFWGKKGSRPGATPAAAAGAVVGDSKRNTANPTNPATNAQTVAPPAMPTPAMPHPPAPALQRTAPSVASVPTEPTAAPSPAINPAFSQPQPAAVALGRQSRRSNAGKPVADELPATANAALTLDASHTRAQYRDAQGGAGQAQLSGAVFAEGALGLPVYPGAVASPGLSSTSSDSVAGSTSVATYFSAEPLANLIRFYRQEAHAMNPAQRLATEPDAELGSGTWRMNVVDKSSGATSSVSLNHEGSVVRVTVVRWQPPVRPGG